MTDNNDITTYVFIAIVLVMMYRNKRKRLQYKMLQRDRQGEFLPQLKRTRRP